VTFGALAALLLAFPPGPELPEGAARFRVELGGARVGVADLSVQCRGEHRGWRVTWRTALRLPADAGGGVRERRLVTELDGEGRADLVLVGDRRVVAPAFPERGCPASAAELVLAGSPEGRCLTVFEEETGRTGPACLVAIAPDGVRRLTVLGVEERLRCGADGFPERVELPAQGAAYVRDAGAVVPAEVPLSVRVGGPAAAEAARFCGHPPDRGPPPGVGAGLPAARPDGRSCQAQAAQYAAAARRSGLDARIAVGVAHDGDGFVWHAWAEVLTAAGWIAVDPAFGQLPAHGPRFTVARHGGDAAGRQDAGRDILACWGKAVE
jgi:hypothetical protein